ncbi:MAG: TolC family protein [Terriglobales bacterium]
MTYPTDSFRNLLLAGMGCLLLGGVGLAQQRPAGSSGAEIRASNTATPQKLDFMSRGGWFNFWQRYQPADIGEPDLTNPAALREAVAKGTLYLSLRAMLEMALTSDLDIANASYAKLEAEPDYLRTLAGGTARGVAGETISSALFSGAIGASTIGGGSGGYSSAGSATGGGSGVHGGGGGYDPTFNLSWGDEHTRQPLLTSSIYGTAEQILNQNSVSAGYGQSFTTGTGYSVTFYSLRQYQNSNELFLNPQVSSAASIGVSQELLQGARRSVNRAGMVMGANSLQYADANYKDQVTKVVSAAITQYWTLVGAQQQIAIAEKAEQDAQKTLDDTNALVQNGKVPAANRITAETGLSTAISAVLQAKTDYAKAASKLKLYLVKQWNPNVIRARVVPTNALPLPAASQLAPAPQLVSTALSSSPELAEDRINVNNGALVVKIREDSLLPSLTVVGDYTSSGVAGVGVNCSVPLFPCPVADITGASSQGLLSSLGRIFSYRAPDYGFGFSLSVPVFNRENRADEATAELQLAANRITLQKDEDAVTEQVNEDRIELEGQVAQLQSAQKAQQQFQQALVNARAVYQMGTGTINDVEAAENALTTAEKAVVAAQQAYAIAQVTLAGDSGTLLKEYHISLGTPLARQNIHNLP